LDPDGSFAYTPTLDFHGVDSFTYYATDTISDSNLATVILTVVAVNDPPLAVGDSYTTGEDMPLPVAAPGVLTNDGDVDGDPLAAVLDTSPLSGTLVLNPDGSFTYTPTLDFSGVETFTYHATDTISDSNVAAVTLTVTAVNDPPVAMADGYTATEDTPLIVAAPGVLANDGDVDGDALATVLDTSPMSGTLVLNPDGSFTYTPTLHFAGLDTFTYHATDTISASNLATVTLTVQVRPAHFVYLPLVLKNH
jgi:VCBS repeat-containing protein